jgi:dihydroxyacetone kinase-like predicted kinase
VVATRSIPEGLSAAAAFNPMSQPKDANEQMAAAAQAVTAAAVTRAVRDASTPAGDVHEGDWLGVVDGDATVIGEDPVDVAKELVRGLSTDDHEMLTILVGADASEDDAKRLAEALETTYGDLEVEIHRGDQPGYPFLLGLE